MRIRPCIDIHDGRVKQIVGSSLRDSASPCGGREENPSSGTMCGGSSPDYRSSDAARRTAEGDEAADSLQENFVAEKSADYYASVYRRENLPGGHIILLNPVREEEAYAADRRQALLALGEYPGGMQVGGGITPDTAENFLQAGASHVIVRPARPIWFWIFPAEGRRTAPMRW